MEIGTALPRDLRGIVMPSRSAGVTSSVRDDGPAGEEEAAWSRDVNTAAWEEELDGGAARASKVWILAFMFEREDWMDDSADRMASFAGAAEPTAGAGALALLGGGAAAGVCASAGFRELCLRLAAAFRGAEEGRWSAGGDWNPAQSRNRLNNSWCDAPTGAVMSLQNRNSNSFGIGQSSIRGIFAALPVRRELRRRGGGLSSSQMASSASEFCCDSMMRSNCHGSSSWTEVSDIRSSRVSITTSRDVFFMREFVLRLRAEEAAKGAGLELLK